MEFLSYSSYFLSKHRSLESSSSCFTHLVKISTCFSHFIIEYEIRETEVKRVSFSLNLIGCHSLGTRRHTVDPQYP